MNLFDLGLDFEQFFEPSGAQAFALVHYFFFVEFLKYIKSLLLVKKSFFFLFYIFLRHRWGLVELGSLVVSGEAEQALED